MKMYKSNRREFIKLTAIAIVAAPSVITTQQVAGQQTEKLSEDDPAAIALGYKERTTDVDAAKYTTHSKDQICKDCVLYQGDDPEWGGCGAFPGKLVAGQGWCQAYAAKPA